MKGTPVRKRCENHRQSMWLFPGKHQESLLPEDAVLLSSNFLLYVNFNNSYYLYITV